MAHDWPQGFPYPLRQGYSIQRGDGRHITKMDQGAPRIRRRYANVPTRFSVSFILTSEQAATFDDFWDTTLQGGVGHVNLPVKEFTGLTTREVKIIKVGKFQPVGMGAFKVAIQVVTV